ncbi:nucleoside hydrolase [Leifsonia poae]|uniref:nucleoside hydrolase n=1 Tax=Leifsonia poae TaxID=110933 RepID=UPI0027DEC5AB|nr:nucleoside hydrolase [Leifsonia poae]
MKVTTLGSATPYPRPDNGCSGYLVEAEGTALWVDAGPGTLAELQRHVPLRGVDGIWISHTHADHSSDLLTAFYAFRFGDLPPGPPVPLFAPPALRERLVAFLGGSAREGIDRAFRFVELAAADSARLGALDLRWRGVDHDVPGFALRVDSPAGSLVYSGDSAPCADLDQLAEGCDVLLCEAGVDARQPGEHPAHHTPEEAGATATRSGAHALVVTHIALGVTEEEAESRARTAFAGPVSAARPGVAFTVGSAENAAHGARRPPGRGSLDSETRHPIRSGAGVDRPHRPQGETMTTPAPVAARPVYFDCDTGIDDSLALAYLLASPEIELVGIGTVSGNVSAEQAADNTLRLLALAGREDIPVAVGAHDFLAAEFDGGATHVHGDNGIGGVELPEAAARPVEEDAAHFLVRLAREHSGRLTVIAVGPATNLAVALALDPALPTRVAEVVMMGGAALVPGNVTPVAEANIWNDPEAAAELVAAPWPVTLVPLDVTMENVFEEADRQRLLGSELPLARAVGAMLDFYFDFYVDVYGHRSCALHDPLAAAIAVGGVRPTVAPEVDVVVDATGGPGRGQTICDLRGQRSGAADQPEHMCASCSAPIDRSRPICSAGCSARPASAHSASPGTGGSG